MLYKSLKGNSFVLVWIHDDPSRATIQFLLTGNSCITRTSWVNEHFTPSDDYSDARQQVNA